MKLLNKALVALFALTLLLGTGINVFADGYTVTITQNADDKGTHTYGAYQIFAGDIATDGTLSNIVWGSGITDAGKTALGNATEYAKGMTTTNASEKATQLAGYLSTAEKTGSDKIEGLEGGYYLIKDENDPTGSKPSSQTKYILKVVNDVTVKVKSSVPSVVKKVQDINDSDNEPTLSGLQDSADYDIGDTIPYTITATIGSGIANYSAYSFQFVDEMSKGLTLDESTWDIKVGEKSIKNLFTLTSTGTDSKTWTWSATNIKPEITDGKQVVLTYNCTLNKDAVIGSTGNPNTVKLKFDNNPNNCGKGSPAGETPWDKNIVFTYKTVFYKVDGSNNNVALTGADFKLEKKTGPDTYTDVTTLHTGEGVANPTKTGDSTGSTFTFLGLDDGTYRLTEITTPSGYNTIEPIIFTITAGHEVTSDNPSLTSLTGAGGASFTMTPNLADGSLTATIQNQKGSTLPSTGGAGTTAFYVIGGVLVAGAAVMLIAKNRFSNNK